MAPTGTRVRGDRREQLLRVSLHLFRTRGYHGTGINDIGEAAGVTGPAIYRHFATKDDLLVAAINEGIERMRAGAEAVLAADLDAVETVRRLCAAYVSFAIDDPDLLAVYLFEARHLPAAKRAPLRRRSNATAAEFTRLLRAARPELGEKEATTMVGAALFMVAGIILEPPVLDDGALRALLTDRMIVLLLTP